MNVTVDNDPVIVPVIVTNMRCRKDHLTPVKYHIIIGDFSMFF